MHGVETMATIVAPRGALARVLSRYEGRAGQVGLTRLVSKAGYTQHSYRNYR